MIEKIPVNPEITDKTLDEEGLKEAFENIFGIDIDNDEEVYIFEFNGELNSMIEVW